MPINWEKIQANLSGEPGATPQSSKIDWKKIEERLPKKPEPTPTPTPAPVTMPSAMENARNLYQGSGFQAFGKTILPAPKPIETTQSRRNPFEGLNSFTPDTSIKTTTPMFNDREQGVLSEMFGIVRAGSDWLSLPLSLGLNTASFKEKEKAVKTGVGQTTPSMIESTAIDPKLIVDATKQIAINDIKTGGTWSIDKAGVDYLKSRNVKKVEDVKLQDYAVLGSLGFFHMFGDPAIGIPGSKALKEFVVWKRVGGIEKPLKEGASISKGRVLEMPIAKDLKIKVTPSKNSVTFEGYVRRGSKGEILNPETEIKGIADEISKATGKEVVPIAKGDNLVLQATGEELASTKSIKPAEQLTFGNKPTLQPEISANDIRNWRETELPVIQETNAAASQIDALARENGFKNVIITDKKITDVINGQTAPTGVMPSTRTLYINKQDLAKDVSDILSGGQISIADNAYVAKTIKEYVNELVRFEKYHLNSTIQDSIDLASGDKEIIRAAKERMDKAAIESYKAEIATQKSPTKAMADKGGYAELPVEKKAEYKAIETPELYRMVKQIDKDLPISVKNYQKFLGVFQSGGVEGEKIGLSRKLFKTIEGETPEAKQQRVAKTFAHEIGHYVDYLPDKNIKRGNLNGRLLVVDNFKKNFVDDESILNKRKELKRKIAKIANDPVLLESRIKELTEPLKNDLAELDNKIQFNNKIFKDELVKLTKEWKPWEEGRDAGYDSYRKSAPELYADFVSVLFNNPGLAEEMAPKFYKEFFSSLDKKPEVQKAFLEIQAELNGDRPSLMEKRWRMLKDSGLNAQGKFMAMVEEGKANNKYPWLTNLKRDAWYQHYWAKDVSKKTEYLMEEYDRGFNNELYIWSNKELKPIFDEMKTAGIDSNDLDAVLKLERMASDVTRQEVANIKGLDQSTSEDVLQELTNIVGEEKAGAMFKAADKLRKVLRDTQLKYPDLWNSETKELIESNKFYAPFNVLFSESQNIPYFIKQSKGNIDKDFNTVTNTLLRAKAVMNFGERNLAKKTVIDEMISNGFKEMKPVKKMVIKGENGQVFTEFEKAPKGMDLVQIKRDGKLEGYFLPKDIASSLNDTNVGELASVLRPFRAMLKPFKKLYTELNPAFQVVNFLFRDWGQANMFFSPEWSRAQLGKRVSTPGDIIANNTYRYLLSQFKQGKYYYKALKNIKEKNLFSRYTPVVEEALKNHIIEIDGTGMYKLEPNKFSETEEKAVDYILQTMGLTNKAKGWKRAGEVIKGIGQTLEETPKLAAYMHLKDMGVLAEDTSKQYNSIIRNYVGSPNFWKRGKNAQEISSLMMFYNPIIRGQENLAYKAFAKDAAGKGSRTAFWWRMIRKAFIPALIGIAAEEGFFGDDIKKEYNKNPEYLKNNYYTIPLGETENRKIRSITIPLDEDSRLMHALVRMTAKAALHGGDKTIAKRAIWDILSYTGGQVPSPNPVIKIASAWGTALSGGNPYDNFRQQHIFLANEEKLLFSEKAKILTKWTLNQSGQLKLDLRDGIDNKPVDEQAIQYTPIVNRFYRITDRGDYEQDQKVAKEVEQQEAMRLLEKTKELNDIAEKLGKGEKIDISTEITQLAKNRLGAEASDAAKYNKEVKLLLNSLQDKYISSFGNVHFRSLMNASNEQKEAILIDIHGRETMNNKEYQKMINDALQLKIINQEVAANVANAISQK